MINLVRYSFAVLLFTAIAQMAVPQAQAVEGGVSGGGGEVVIFNDHVVLADPYFQSAEQDQGIFSCPAGTRGTLHNEIKKELQRVSRILGSYGAINNDLRSSSTFFASNSPESTFIAEHVLSSKVSYCFVDKLPQQAEKMKLDIPEGSSAEQVAYTEGLVTFIRQDLAKKMTVRELAKTIFHERMHGAIGGVKHGPIVTVTDGLEVALDLMQRQHQAFVKGKLIPRTTTEEVKKLRSLVSAMQNLGMTNREVELEPNGGGARDASAIVHENAFISVGSYVGPKVRVYSDAKVISSTVCYDVNSTKAHDFRIFKFAEVTNSTISQCYGMKTVFLNKKSRILNSTIIFNSFLGRGSESSMSSFYTDGEPFKFGMWIGKGAQIINTHLEISRLALGENAKIRNLEMSATPGLWRGQDDAGVRLDLEDDAELKNGRIWANNAFGRDKMKNFVVFFNDDYSIYDTSQLIIKEKVKVDLRNRYCKSGIALDEEGRDYTSPVRLSISEKVVIEEADDLIDELYCD